MKKHSNYPFEIPNGALKETEDPCDSCGGHSKIARRWNDNFQTALFYHNGQWLCRRCAKQNKVI